MASATIDAAAPEITNPVTARLLYGDTDRLRLNKVVDDLFKLSASDSESERNVILGQLQDTLDLVEFSAAKTAKVVSMNDKQSEVCAAECGVFSGKLEQRKSDTVEAKQKLADAWQNRKQQEEYDALATIILKLPSRQQSLASTAKVQAELDNLSEETTKLDLKFQERQRQFQLLVHSIKELRETLQQDGSLEDENEQTNDGNTKNEENEDSMDVS